MIRHLFRIVPALAAAGGLTAAGCSTTIVEPATLSTGYDGGTFGYAARGGTMPMLVLGNTTTLPQDRFAEEVRAVAEAPGYFPATQFTPAPLDAGEGYRIVLAFNQANVNIASSLCRPATVATLPAPLEGDRTTLDAAFCGGTAPVSYVRGTLPAIVGVNDPALQELVNQVLVDLLPQRNLDLEDRPEPYVPG